MKHLKIISVLMSVAMYMSFAMTPVSVLADETEAPEQTTETTETTEAPDTKETEAAKETAKATEPSKETEAAKETEPPKETEAAPSEESAPETAVESTPSESVPETTETEPSVQDKEIKEPSKAPVSSAKKPAKNAGETYTITVMPVSHGTITLSQYEAHYGDEVKVTAIPDPGYFYYGYRISGEEGMYLDDTTIYVYSKKDYVVEFFFNEIKAHDIGHKFDKNVLNFTVTNNALDGTGTVKCTGFLNIVSQDSPWAPTFYSSVTVPETVTYEGITYKVTVIDSNAFKNQKHLKTAVIGSNVTVIGTNAFYGCPFLTKVSGGAGLKTIGANAFARCPKLATFVITSKVLSKIGTYAYTKDSSLKTIYIRNTVSLTKKGVKKSLKGSKVKTVKVKKSKVKKYKKYFTKKNCGRKVKVKK